MSEVDRATITDLMAASVVVPLRRDTCNIVFIIRAGVGIGVGLVFEHQIEGLVKEVVRGFVRRRALEARERLETLILRRGAGVVALVVYDLLVRVSTRTKPWKNVTYIGE